MVASIVGCFRATTGVCPLRQLMFAALLVSVVPAFGGSPGAVAYRGATLIDGTGRPAVENATLLVQGARFVAVGADLALPDDVEIVDAAGKWIVPGLIDAHLHFMVSGRIYTRPSFIDLQHLVPYDEEVAWIKRRIPVTLRSLLCSGVTSALSMGGPSVEYDARALARTMPDAPTVFVGHGPITQLPEFLAGMVFPPFDGELSIKSARDEAAGRALVQEAAAMEAEFIKTVYDASGSLMRRLVQWGYEDVTGAIVAEASRHKLKVTSHSHELEPARTLLQAGIDSLQHQPVDAEVDEAFIALARERDAIVVPTLILRKRTFVDTFTQQFDFLPVEETCGDPDVIKSWFEVAELPVLGSDRIRTVIEQTPMAYRNTKALYEGGVALAVGTDAGNSGMLHGPSMHLELIEMRKAGIPEGDLIVMATLNAARVAGMEALYGSVEAGKFADFLILSANPLTDIANLQRIDVVVKHGRAFAQHELVPALTVR